MKIQSVFSKAFAPYGKVLEGYNAEPLLQALDQTTPCPPDATVYEPSDKQLEALPIFTEFSQKAYGGLPIQIGYCNGFNTKLNCLEYHRGSELNIPSSDMILLLARACDIHRGKLNTKTVKAFRVPKGTIVQVYETTLHYAPCCNILPDGSISTGFRVIIVLPRETNTEKPSIEIRNTEDAMLWAKNKWLLAHPASSEAKQGAFVGLTGKNIDISLLK